MAVSCNDGVADTVRATPGAIGYVSSGRADAEGLAAVMLCNLDGRFVAASEATCRSAILHSHLFRREQDMASLVEQPGSQTWPITMTSFVLTDAQLATAAAAAAVLNLPPSWKMGGSEGKKGRAIACRVEPTNEPLSVKSVTGKIRGTLEGLPDHRAGGNNQRYRIADAALSAFSVFFTQSPSFLDYQVRMQQQRGRNNAQPLFGVHEIPSDNQIRNLLDPIPQDRLFPLMAEVGESLVRHTGLQDWRAINGQVLIALDGTDSCFSSGKISCPCCTRQTLRNGKTQYRHSVVAPGQERVVPLPPQFIEPQDGHDKQDCELAASHRWLNQWAARYAPWGVTLLGDDLYCHQPFCEQVQAHGMNFIFTCKPGSHALLSEWIEDMARTGRLQSVVHTRWDGKRRLHDTYRYVNQIPLRDSDDALLVNWCE